jgi:hypothetical protein
MEKRKPKLQYCNLKQEGQGHTHRFSWNLIEVMLIYICEEEISVHKYWTLCLEVKTLKGFIQLGSTDIIS